MEGNELGNDLLVGAPAIAAYLNVNERRVYHWATRNYIPTFKIGPLIAARRSELDEALSNGRRSDG
jgi:hypothetical protein